jgi:hypothetical protein
MDRACAASSKLFSPNPIVKVLTRRLLCACIMATTADEAMPPDKNAPTGTSAGHLPAHGVAQQHIEAVDSTGFAEIETVALRLATICAGSQ